MLTWEAKPLCSRRVTNFTDTNLTSPTPSNASAKTLSISDIPSSRCLFRLRLLAHPTEETGSSSSRTMMLITPTSVQMTDPPEKMKERKEKNGYRNGTTYTSLETQVKYDPKVQGLIRTPSAMDARNWESAEYTGGGTLAQEIMQNEKLKGLLPTPQVKCATGGAHKLDENGKLIQTTKNTPFSPQLTDLAKSGLLPTPTAMDNVHPDAEIDATTGRRIAKNGNATHSQGLSDLAHHGLLPTPLAVDVSHKKRVEANRKSGVSFKSRENGDARPNGLTDFLQFHGMLPTPNAGEAEHYRLQYTPGSQMGTSLSALGASGQLPTPSARDWKGKTNPGTVKPGSGCVYGETLPDTIDRVCSPEQDGQTSRLSPLFTEEMMGFPFGWTTFPFLSQSGEPNP